jgi:hypothetical protein
MCIRDSRRNRSLILYVPILRKFGKNYQKSNNGVFCGISHLIGMSIVTVLPHKWQM